MTKRLPPTAFEIKVVESSSDRILPPEEMAKLRVAVVKYLADRGESLRGGTYQVRVNFEPTQPGEPGEWMHVQLIVQPLEPYTLVAAYQDMSPYYYPAYARSAYSSDGYSDYYYDPYEYSYGGRYYLPPPVTRQTGHKPVDWDRTDKSHDRGRGKRPVDRDRGDRPPGTDTRGDGRDQDRDHRPRTVDSTPRSHDPDRGRSRDSGNYGPTTARVSDSSSSSSNSSSGSTSSSYSPPPSSSSRQPSSPVRSESSNSSSQKMPAQKDEK